MRLVYQPTLCYSSANADHVCLPGIASKSYHTGSKSNCYNTIEGSAQQTNDLAHGGLVMRKLYFPSIHLSMRYGSP